MICPREREVEYHQSKAQQRKERMNEREKNGSPLWCVLVPHRRPFVAWAIPPSLAFMKRKKEEMMNDDSIEWKEMGEQRDDDGFPTPTK